MVGPILCAWLVYVLFMFRTFCKATERALSWVEVISENYGDAIRPPQKVDGSP